LGLFAKSTFWQKLKNETFAKKTLFNLKTQIFKHNFNNVLNLIYKPVNCQAVYMESDFLEGDVLTTEGNAAETEFQVTKQSRLTTNSYNHSKNKIKCLEEYLAMVLNGKALKFLHMGKLKIKQPLL
jgi:hypothetical protein